MGIDVWRLRGRSNTSTIAGSEGEADQAQARAVEPQRSVDDRDLTNVSLNEPARADSVQVPAEKVSSSPEPADAVPASVGDIAASRELHAAFYDYRTLLICGSQSETRKRFVSSSLPMMWCGLTTAGGQIAVSYGLEASRRRPAV